MKYSVHDYSKALAAAASEPKANAATIEKNFLALVRRNGDEGRLKKILDESGRLMRSRAGVNAPGRDVLIESARPLGKSQEALIKNLLKSGDVVRRRTDPGLVAGVKITVNDEMQFDGTLAAKLDSLFGVGI